MDIKEAGVCGVIVVGGAVFGIAQGGLGDALSDDIKPYYEVSQEDRAEYMDSIVSQFTETFDTYFVQTESYTYAGQSTFSTQPSHGLFNEVVRQEEKIPSNEIAEIKARMDPEGFCGQDEMLLFTEKGWQYRFTLKHGNNQTVAMIVCHPTGAQGSV